MRTYVVEIEGEPVVAFRAEQAQAMLRGERGDTRPLWHGIPKLTVRIANERETRRWEKARSAAIVPVHEGYLIDLQNGVDPLEADEGEELSWSSDQVRR